MYAPRLHAHPHDMQTLSPASLEASDDWDAGPATPAGGCPPALLAEFCSRMAGQGRTVDQSMMQRDRDYALWQIACARTRGDAGLAELARRLFACVAGRPVAHSH
jgi:hypothetical protein